ncbi:MAG: ABC transporter ATP-binding protein [Thermoplasmatota archaeon]
MPPAVKVRGLTKRFGDLVAVDGLDLDVNEGEIFGFLGPNGAGKTTTISIMTGLLKPTSGTTEVLGQQIIAGGNADARALIGVAPQDAVLWKTLTCEENLTFIGEMYGLHASEAERRATALLAQVGLTDKTAVRADELSGGMKRRLNMAMALMHEPKVLVLDEPEAGLDPQARVVVRDFLRAMKGSRTIILTTHNMDEAERIVDRVGIIDHGKLIALDTPEALKDKFGAGDVIEVQLASRATTGEGGAADSAAEPPAFDVAPVAQRLRDLKLGDVATVGQTVIVRGLGLASQFPAVLREVEASGAKIVDVRYRANTLEDVFIALTGRALRE